MHVYNLCRNSMEAQPLLFFSINIICLSGIKKRKKKFRTKTKDFMKTHAGSFCMSLINLRAFITLKTCGTDQKTLMPVSVFTKSLVIVWSYVPKTFSIIKCAFSTMTLVLCRMHTECVAINKRVAIMLFKSFLCHPIFIPQLNQEKDFL